MPDTLTDAQLLEAAQDPRYRDRLETVLTSEELRRLTRLRGSAPSWTDTAVEALPLAGGVVGGLLGAASGLPTLGLGSGPGAVIGAGMLGAGGEAAKQLINRVRGVPAPETPTEAATEIAVQGAGQAAGELTGQAAVRGATALGRGVYRGVLKPSLAARSLKKGEAIVETGIREGLPVSARGVARAQRLEAQVRAQVDALLQDAEAAGATVSLPQVARTVRDWAIRTYDKPGVPPADLQAALSVVDDLLRHPVATVGLGDVGVTTGQAIKQGLDRAIGETAFGVASGATKSAQKVARATMRRHLETATVAEGFHGLGRMNAREGALIDAGKAILRAVNREANQNPLKNVNTWLSLGTGGAHLARTGDPYSAAAVALGTRLALNPAVSSRAAIVAARLGAKSRASAATVAKAAIAAVLSGEEQDLPPSEDE